MALAGIRQLRSQRLVSAHPHRTKGVTGSEGREGAYEVRGAIRVGGVNGDGNGVGDKNGDGDVDGEGDGTGTRTGVEASEETQDGNVDECGNPWTNKG